MNPPSQASLDVVRPLLRPVDDRPLGWIGSFFGAATMVGLGLFGVNIALRAPPRCAVDALVGRA